MTPHQVIFWVAMVPITGIVWAKVLSQPCVRGLCSRSGGGAEPTAAGAKAGQINRDLPVCAAVLEGRRADQGLVLG